MCPPPITTLARSGRSDATNAASPVAAIKNTVAVGLDEIKKGLVRKAGQTNLLERLRHEARVLRGRGARVVGGSRIAATLRV
jgi:hypothetical protein